MGVGIMLGPGGSAIIARRLGEGKEEQARETFSLVVCFALMVGVVLSVLCFVFIAPLSRALGADEEQRQNTADKIACDRPPCRPRNAHITKHDKHIVK